MTSSGLIAAETTLSRLLCPVTTESIDFDTPRAFDSWEITSVLASPSRGGAIDLISRSPLFVHTTPSVRAPGLTCTARCTAPARPAERNGAEARNIYTCIVARDCKPFVYYDRPNVDINPSCIANLFGNSTSLHYSQVDGIQQIQLTADAHTENNSNKTQEATSRSLGTKSATQHCNTQLDVALSTADFGCTSSRGSSAHERLRRRPLISS